MIALAIGFALCGASSKEMKCESIEEPKNQSAATEKTETTKPPIVINILPPQKTKEVIEQEAKERDEKAELDRKLIKLTGNLADYTLGLFIATFALVITSAGLLWLGCNQSNDMKASVVAAQSAAEAANKSAIVAESALKDIERAFVYFSSPFVLQPEHQQSTYADYIFNFEWINSGKTWTKESFHHISWGTVDRQIDENFAFPEMGDPPGKIFIGPGARVNGGPLSISHAHITAAMEGRCHLYFWGWCEYDDVFTGTPRHRTEFCIRMNPIQRLTDAADGARRAAVTFSYHAAHNGADDDCLKPVQTGSRKNPIAPIRE